jgi:hypothetical protein
MKTIYVTIGYKVVEDGKPTRYYGDQTDNGVCYKDLEAFKDNSDICYIPECELLEDWSADEDILGLGYAKEDVLNIARDYISDEGIPVEEDFVEYIAECALQNVDWQGIGTYLNEIDIYETWEYYKGIKG